jgi:hypothetical protein
MSEVLKLLDTDTVTAATSVAVVLPSGVHPTKINFIDSTGEVDNSVIQDVVFSTTVPETTFTVNFTGTVTGTLQTFSSNLYVDLKTFVGDSGSGGTSGAVPAPATGEAGYLLTGDASWNDPFSVFTGIEGTFLEQTATFSTTSTTDVAITSFSITPGAGTYNVYFTASVTNSKNGDATILTVYANGVALPASERTSSGQAGNTQGLATHTQVTVADAQAIDVRIRTDSTTNATASAFNRSLYVERIG